MRHQTVVVQTDSGPALVFDTAKKRYVYHAARTPPSSTPSTPKTPRASGSRSSSRRFRTFPAPSWRLAPPTRPPTRWIVSLPSTSAMASPTTSSSRSQLAPMSSTALARRTTRSSNASQLDSRILLRNSVSSAQSPLNSPIAPLAYLHRRRHRRLAHRTPPPERAAAISHRKENHAQEKCR